MIINSAEKRGGELVINAPPADIIKFLANFKAGEYEIKKAVKKRSLDANAYFFVLVDKLAKAMQIPKLDIYRNSIKEIGGVSETFCMKSDAVKRFCDTWNNNGLGWQTETFPSKIDGCTNVIAYYGSSTFDKAQMARLIDCVVQDCEALDIETKPQEEINSLLEQWEGKCVKQDEAKPLK